jgi:hypothetical protein
MPALIHNAVIAHTALFIKTSTKYGFLSKDTFKKKYKSNYSTCQIKSQASSCRLFPISKGGTSHLSLRSSGRSGPLFPTGGLSLSLTEQLPVSKFSMPVFKAEYGFLPASSRRSDLMEYLP